MSPRPLSLPPCSLHAFLRVPKWHRRLPARSRGDTPWSPLCCGGHGRFLRLFVPTPPQPTHPQSSLSCPQKALVSLGTLIRGGGGSLLGNPISSSQFCAPQSSQLSHLLSLLASAVMLVNGNIIYPCSAWSLLLWPGKGRVFGAARVSLPPGALAAAVTVTVTHCSENPLFLPVVSDWSCGNDGMGL